MIVDRKCSQQRPDLGVFFVILVVPMKTRSDVHRKKKLKSVYVT